MITTSLYLWWRWAWYTVLYLVSYLFYCQCIIYVLGAFGIIGWLIVRTGGSLKIWKVRTCKAVLSELGLASWLQVTVSFHCNVVLHWESLFKPCMSLADIQENTVHSLKSLGLLRGTQVVKEAMPLVIWTKTSWPELYKEGACIHSPQFLPLCWLWESTFSWEPTALSAELSLVPCLSLW